MLHLIDHIMRDSEGFFAEIRDDVDIGGKLRALAWLFVVVTVPYGFAMGASGGLMTPDGWFFALASAVKVPFLFLVTMVVCLPATYVTNVLIGPGMVFRNLLTLVLATFAVVGTVLAACLPIVVFFLISGRSYIFMKLLNIGIFAVAGLYGLYFLWRGLAIVRGKRAAADTTSVKIWMVIYGFVGAQMAWVLRPFFGGAHKSFVLFKPQESNFYANLIETIGRALGR
jgi:hypothetical protein